MELKRSTVVANYIALLGLLPLWATYSHVSTDDDITTCRALNLYALVMYFLINFALYRILLFKSQVYDAMKEYIRTYNFVFMAVHIVAPMLILSVIFLGSIGDYEILTENISGGTRLCVITGYSVLPFLDQAAFALTLVAAVADLSISIGCLALLVLPIFKPGFTATGNTGVVRNVIFSSIAILSTFSILVVIATIEYQDSMYTIGLVLDLGGLDLFINIVSVNCCWPLKFYYKSMRKLFASMFGFEESTTQHSRQASKQMGQTKHSRQKRRSHLERKEPIDPKLNKTLVTPNSTVIALVTSPPVHPIIEPTHTRKNTITRYIQPCHARSNPMTRYTEPSRTRTDTSPRQSSGDNEISISVAMRPLNVRVGLGLGLDFRLGLGLRIGFRLGF
ncbi:hypothetical protein AAMO2058_000423700 [Amorphochlora amoebiformis]